MEIIAKTNDGYIVKIVKLELEMLTGYYYGKSDFRIGEEVKVDTLFSQLTKLNSQEEEIKRMAHSLKTAAGMLEKIDPVFHVKEK